MKTRVNGTMALLAILVLIFTSICCSKNTSTPVDFTQMTTPPSTSTPEVMQVTLTFKEPALEKVEVWDWLKLDDCTYISTSGHPALPIYTKTLKLDKGAQVRTIEIKELDTVVMKGEYNIMPALMPQPLATATNESVLTKPDHKIYNTNAVYPPEKFTYAMGNGIDTESMTQVTYLNIHFYPLSYNPVQMSITRVKSVTLVITFSPLPNYTVATPLTSSPIRLCIIYPPVLATQATNLESFKDSHGYDAFSVSTDTIYTGIGYDYPEKIRNYIRNETITYGTLYYILFGDSDLIPARYVYIPDSSYDTDDSVDGTNVETDLYYAELDLDWDYNGNHVWGEVPGDIDTTALPLPDVILGRLPASNTAEADVLVNKIINYNNTLQQKKYLMLGTDTFSAPGAEGEIVKNSIDGFVPAAMTKTKLYETLGTLNPTNVTNQINSGQGWLNFAGHGFWDSWSLGTGGSYTIANTNTLNNGNYLPVITVMSCLTARWADRECIAEKFLLNANGGAIAYLGSSRVTWGYVGSSCPAGLAGWLDIRFNNNYFVGSSSKPGEVLASSLTDYINTFGIGALSMYGYLDWKVAAEYGNLLGDPSISIRLANDLWMQTGPYDNGNTPVPTQPWWSAPDIAVDNNLGTGWQTPASGSFITHENPEAGEINRVYFRVHNLGCREATNVQVKLYWADPAGGIPWPSDWNEINLVPYNIPSIPAGGTYIDYVEWTPPVAETGHRCLLVTAECDADPISVYAPRFDNNVAQRNVNIINLRSAVKVKFVLNTLTEQGKRDLTITMLKAPKGATAKIRIPSTMSIGKVEGASNFSEPSSGWFFSCQCNPFWQITTTSISQDTDTITIIPNIKCDKKVVIELEIEVPNDLGTTGEFILRITEQIDNETIGGIDYIVRY